MNEAFRLPVVGVTWAIEFVFDKWSYISIHDVRMTEEIPFSMFYSAWVAKSVVWISFLINKS